MEPRPTDAILAAARAYQESRVLLTALELDIFSAAAGGAGAPEIAARVGGEPRATTMLLDALAALGALEKRDGTYACTAGTRPLGPARPGLMHLVNRWSSWGTLTDCVRAGTRMIPGRPEGEDPAWTEAFIEAMHARAGQIAPAVVEAVGARGVRRLLDVGGGPGTFALAFARAEPELRAEILDLPQVLPIARRHVAEAGLEDRVTVREGDLRTDDFGEGHDLVLLGAICHMLDEAGNADLIRRCARALVPGGRLAIRDFLLEADRTAPREAALFALNMLVGTERGNCYTEAEYRGWLADAGFQDVRRIPGQDLLVATRTTS